MKKIKYIIGIILIFILDQISKLIIMNSMSLNESIKVIGNFFKLTYTHNSGAAFGILEGKQILILIITILILGYLLYELFKKNNSKLNNISTIMIIGGLLGNLFDRIYFGIVRDFLDFIIFGYDFAVFNIADIAIVLGACCYFISIIKEDKNENKNN